MEPRIPVGSLAVADMHRGYGSIEKATSSSSRQGGRVMHRVYAVTGRGLETKGDANQATDGVTTTHRNFRGRVVFHVPFLEAHGRGNAEAVPVAQVRFWFSFIFRGCAAGTWKRLGNL